MLNYLFQILKNCVQTHCYKKRTKVVLVPLNFNRIRSPLVCTTYNLQICLFFMIFFDFFGIGHIFSRNIHRSADMTCNVAQMLVTICIASKSLWTLHLFRNILWRCAGAWYHMCCLEKSLNTPICSFFVKPKIASKWTWKQPHIRPKPHDSFPMTYHVPRRNLVASGI